MSRLCKSLSLCWEESSLELAKRNIGRPASGKSRKQGATSADRRFSQRLGPNDLMASRQRRKETRAKFP